MALRWNDPDIINTQICSFWCFTSKILQKISFYRHYTVNIFSKSFFNRLCLKHCRFYQTIVNSSKWRKRSKMLSTFVSITKKLHYFFSVNHPNISRPMHRNASIRFVRRNPVPKQYWKKRWYKYIYDSLYLCSFFSVTSSFSSLVALFISIPPWRKLLSWSTSDQQRRGGWFDRKTRVVVLFPANR